MHDIAERRNILQVVPRVSRELAIEKHLTSTYHVQMEGSPETKRVMPGRLDNGADLARRTLLTLATMGPAFATDITSAAEPAPTGTVKMPPDLAKTIKEYDQATISKDIVMLGNLVTDDYMLVNSDSTLQDKQSYLADFTAPDFRLDPYVMEEPMLKIWSNTALTAGRLHLAWTQNGKRHNRRVRIAHVWAKTDGRWRLTYTQLTRVA